MPGKRVVAIEVTAPLGTSERRYSIEVLAQDGKHCVTWRNEATSWRLKILGLCVVESLLAEPHVRVRPFLAGLVGWRWERGYTKAQIAQVVSKAPWHARLKAWVSRR